MRNEDSPSQEFSAAIDGAGIIVPSALAPILADLRRLAEENGRLRAERDAAYAERDRLARWIETDRELTNRIITAFETEIQSLRTDVEQLQRRSPVAPVDPVPPAENDPGPSLRTGIGRRFRDRMNDPS